MGQKQGFHSLFATFENLIFAFVWDLEHGAWILLKLPFAQFESFFAKQTQFPKGQNERKLCYNKGL